MPTPEGERSALDSEQAGMPYVDASGIAAAIYHKGGCYGSPSCYCGASGEMKKLAYAFDAALQKFGRDAAFPRPAPERRRR